MKLITLSTLTLAAVVTAYPSLSKRQDDAPAVGIYQAPGPDDVRSPCPALNVLANHGYFPRNGRGLTFNMMTSQLFSVLGAAPDLSGGFALAALTIKGNETSSNDVFGLDNIKTAFGMRDPGETCNGLPCINMDQTRLHGAVEHDVSLVRKDLNEGDNYSVQQNLVDQLVAASSDGRYLTADDFISFRATRLTQQKINNPNLVFGKKESLLAHGEVALLMTILGDRLHGGRIPVEVLKTFIGGETLPTEAGWSKKFVPVTLLELNVLIGELKLKEQFH